MATAVNHNKQLRTIWGMAKQIGMTEDEVRIILHRETGKESMKECSERELQRVILALQVLKGNKNPKGMATNGQMWRIRQLEKSLGWKSDPRRLRGFMKKFYKVERLEWLTFGQASSLIESLKKVLARQAQ